MQANQALDLGRLAPEHRQRLVDLDRVFADVRAVSPQPERRSTPAGPTSAPRRRSDARSSAAAATADRIHDRIEPRLDLGGRSGGELVIGRFGREHLRRSGAPRRPTGIGWLRYQALYQPYDSWPPRMCPTVWRTVHSPPPGSASHVSAARPRQHAMEVPARLRPSPRARARPDRDPAPRRTRRSGRPRSPRWRAPSRSWIA